MRKLFYENLLKCWNHLKKLQIYCREIQSMSKKHLKDLDTRHSTRLTTALGSSLESTFGIVLEEPLYICAAMLDPRLKLNWSNDEEKH